MSLCRFIIIASLVLFYSTEVGTPFLQNPINETRIFFCLSIPSFITSTNVKHTNLSSFVKFGVDSVLLYVTVS